MTKEQEYLKEHFLEPETRSGHYVSAEKKAVWKVILDIVEEVDRICRKHNIKYFLIAGSLLGAIRHKGFIPWDDDLDIALFREDYEKLAKILPKELPKHLFMQNLATDPEFPTAHMYVRDSRTTFIFDWAVNKKFRFNMGIFLDIFVLDGVPLTQKAEAKALKLLCRWRDFHKYRLLKGGAQRKREYVKWILYNCIWHIFGARFIFRLREWAISRFRIGISPDAECVQEPLSWGYTENKYKYYVRDLQETIDVPFEYLVLKAPRNYEALLSRTYGDWRKPVQGASMHVAVEMNASVDYKTVLVEKYGYTWQELRGIGGSS